MSDEISAGFINWFITSVIGLGTVVIGWLMNRAIMRLDDDMKRHAEKLGDHDKQHNRCEIELERFKTEVAKDYAKEATMQQSLARIHDRIDSVGDKVDAGFTEIQKDIKSLIERVK